jgi:hypothetical protein
MSPQLGTTPAHGYMAHELNIQVRAHTLNNM